MFRNLSNSFILVCKKKAYARLIYFLPHRIRTKVLSGIVRMNQLLQMFYNPQVAKYRS